VWLLRKNYFLIFLVVMVLVTLLLAGCVRNYAPQSSWENREFLQSNIRVHPEDVRQNLMRWQNTPIAWTGIIQECEFYENEADYEVILLLEHHYFDWKEENFGMYYPSPRGEGLFQTDWYLKKSADLDYFTERFAPGNLAIVYAVPDTVIDEVVLVKSRYVRIIDRQHFMFDESDYIPFEVLARPKK
jgi:hypothetical protein